MLPALTRPGRQTCVDKGTGRIPKIASTPTKKVGYHGGPNPESTRAARTGGPSAVVRSGCRGHGAGHSAGQEARQGKGWRHAEGEKNACEKGTAPPARPLGCVRRDHEAGRNLRL